MASASKEILQAAIIGFGIPAVLLCLTGALLIPEGQEDPTPTTSITIEETQSVPTTPKQEDLQIPVLIDDEVSMMDLEAYVLGVVLAEMPASFEMEALKAQAVAARTYALQACEDGKKHDGAVCVSYLCCQSFLSEEDYIMKGWNGRYIERVRKAVSETAGLVLTYAGELIRAPYFSCSGGFTEAAEAVWGRDFPYLQAVKSPGEEETVYYTDTTEFTPEAFQEALGTTLVGPVEIWFGELSYTDGGGVDRMDIGGVSYRGTTLRALLGLRSTIFEVIASEEKIVFVTKGYGHRVGMSQYGADAMALEGYGYADILKHYYIDTEIVHYGEMAQENFS